MHAIAFFIPIRIEIKFQDEQELDAWLFENTRAFEPAFSDGQHPKNVSNVSFNDLCYFRYWCGKMQVIFEGLDFSIFSNEPNIQKYF